MKIKIILIFIFSIILFYSCGKEEEGKFFDKRDGTMYKTVKIGKTEWLAENLNFKCEGSYCYDNNEANCEKYGRLYTWDAARTASPSGWHLPTDEEWQYLINFLGKDSSGIKAMTGGSSGFNALFAGTIQPSGNFYLLGNYTAFWSDKEDNANFAWLRYIKPDNNSIGRGSVDKRTGYSVRCVRNY